MKKLIIILKVSADILRYTAPALAALFFLSAMSPGLRAESFSLISPENEATVSCMVILDWEDATDPDGEAFSYTILLSDDNDTFDAPIRMEDMKNSAYLLRPSDGVEDTSHYYWKVQAINEYGMPLQESDVREFQTDTAN